MQLAVALMAFVDLSLQIDWIDIFRDVGLIIGVF